MPLLYVQVKENGCEDSLSIGHYVLEISCERELVSFCKDNDYAGYKLGVKIDTLVSFSPIYDDAMSNEVFNDDIEFFEEEVFSGFLSMNAAAWLSALSQNSFSIQAGLFGGNIYRSDKSPCDLRSINHLVQNLRRNHLQFAKFYPGLHFNQPISLDGQSDKAYLFRELYLRIPQKFTGEVCLYERLVSHTGATQEMARNAALGSGALEAELSGKYDTAESQHIFVGIESFSPLPTTRSFPVLLARQRFEWAWKYDLDDFKEKLLSEILLVNKNRRMENCYPFWN